MLPTVDTVSVGGGGGGYFMVPKSEEVSRPIDFASRLGLNLGGRTYFSSADDDFVNRLYRRTRPGEPGSTNSPRCQAEGCNADLTHAKHYHRRHKVCEFHSKASTVIAAGLTQRFCQQCSSSGTCKLGGELGFSNGRSLFGYRDSVDLARVVQVLLYLFGIALLNFCLVLEFTGKMR
ncbi:hypothetical protein EZV62_009588 [Acer yangbiense]|uniref:SBP-type domain-containing protein n=1 Tax=Acer yangbiense TaxID=1000413 RepID=A0A5C7I0M1_9ROSI|nr:hypothetical protein EZV62_009588 [Acer yangbiense]